MKPDKYLYHLVSRNRWQRLREKKVYRPESLEKEGFIHLCEKGQIEEVLKNEEKAREKLVALKVDPEQLNGDLKYENGFPHLYRELRTEKVEETLEV